MRFDCGSVLVLTAHTASCPASEGRECCCRTTAISEEQLSEWYSLAMSLEDQLAVSDKRVEDWRSEAIWLQTRLYEARKLLNRAEVRCLNIGESIKAPQTDCDCDGCLWFFDRDTWLAKIAP